MIYTYHAAALCSIGNLHIVNPVLMDKMRRQVYHDPYIASRSLSHFIKDESFQVDNPSLLCPFIGIKEFERTFCKTGGY